jgi:hypothetical protein
LQELEARISAFQKLKVPALRLPGKKKKRRKKREVKSVIDEKSDSTERKVIIPLSLRPSPTPDFKLPQLNTSRLGPGSYQLNIRENIPGLYLPQQSRFLSGFDDKIKFFMAKKHSCDNSDLLQIIEKRNKQLEKFIPEIKQKIIIEKAKERDFKAKVLKKTKQILGEQEKKIKEEKYTEKIFKYEWRSKIFELGNLARLLYGIIGLLDVSSLFHFKIIYIKVITI